MFDHGYTEDILIRSKLGKFDSRELTFPLSYISLCVSSNDSGILEVQYGKRLNENSLVIVIDQGWCWMQDILRTTMKQFMRTSLRAFELLSDTLWTLVLS